MSFHPILSLLNQHTHKLNHPQGIRTPTESHPVLYSSLSFSRNHCSFAYRNRSLLPPYQFNLHPVLFLTHVPTLVTLPSNPNLCLQLLFMLLNLDCINVVRLVSSTLSTLVVLILWSHDIACINPVCRLSCVKSFTPTTTRATECQLEANSKGRTQRPTFTNKYTHTHSHHITSQPRLYTYIRLFSYLFNS